MDDSVKQYLIPGNDEFLVSYRGPLHLARQFVSYFFPSDIANNGDWKYRARIPGMRSLTSLTFFTCFLTFFLNFDFIQSV